MAENCGCGSSTLSSFLEEGPSHCNCMTAGLEREGLLSPLMVGGTITSTGAVPGKDSSSDIPFLGDPRLGEGVLSW